MTEIKHIVSSSDGTCLHFPESRLYHQYEKDLKKLKLDYYYRLRALYGIYATNQEKFVSSPEELNQFDSKVMEDLLTLYRKDL